MGQVTPHDPMSLRPCYQTLCGNSLCLSLDTNFIIVCLGLFLLECWYLFFSVRSKKVWEMFIWWLPICPNTYSSNSQKAKAIEWPYSSSQISLEAGASCLRAEYFLKHKTSVWLLTSFVIPYYLFINKYITVKWTL